MRRKRDKSKAKLVAILRQLIAGIEQHVSEPMRLHGQLVSIKAVVAALQQQIDDIHASDAAHDAWLQAVAKQRTGYSDTVAPLVAAVRAYAVTAFGPTGDEYRALGFEPPRPRVTSPETKVVAAAKARATRKARNTMGSKQRLAITGAVPAEIRVTTGTPTILPSATRGSSADDVIK